MSYEYIFHRKWWTGICSSTVWRWGWIFCCGNKQNSRKVLCGQPDSTCFMGKSATPFGAKLILCGNCFLNLLTKCTYKLIFVERSGFLTGVQGIVWRILVGKFRRSFFSSPSNWGNYMFLIFFLSVSMRNFYSLLTFIEYIIILPLLSFSDAYFCKKEAFCQVKK